MKNNWKTSTTIAVCKWNVNCCVCGLWLTLWPASAVSLCPGVLFIHLEAGRQPSCPVTRLQHRPVQGLNRHHMNSCRGRTTWLKKKKKTCPGFTILLGWIQLIYDLYWYLQVSRNKPQHQEYLTNCPRVPVLAQIIILYHVVYESPLTGHHHSAWYLLQCLDDDMDLSEAAYWKLHHHLLINIIN